MSTLGAGAVSGYRSHGPERRADAGHPRADSGSGPGIVVGQHNFSQARPLGGQNRSSAARTGYKTARFVQAAQHALKKKPPVIPSPGGQNPPSPQGNSGGALPSGGSGGGGWTWTATASPAYGGAAYNGGGGKLANVISGTVITPGSSRPQAAVPGGPRQGIMPPAHPGERVTNKPPTSMRQSMAGRDRRAANFRRTHSGPGTGD